MFVHVNDFMRLCGAKRGARGAWIVTRPIEVPSGTVVFAHPGESIIIRLSWWASVKRQTRRALRRLAGV